jgi:hypothetical protein
MPSEQRTGRRRLVMEASPAALGESTHRRFPASCRRTPTMARPRRLYFRTSGRRYRPATTAGSCAAFAQPAARARRSQFAALSRHCCCILIRAPHKLEDERRQTCKPPTRESITGSCIAARKKSLRSSDLELSQQHGSADLCRDKRNGLISRTRTYDAWRAFADRTRRR